MIWAFLFPVLATSELLATREVLSTDLAEGQLFRVRYNVTNAFSHQIFNVTLLDPSFTRADFLFIEGKSKAKLTFGTMKPGAWAYVDLDMEPRRQMSIILTTVKATYNTPEEISEITELFTAGEKISFKSAKEYFIKNIEFYKLLIGVIVLGILPIMYSQRLRTQRMKLYKSS